MIIKIINKKAGIDQDVFCKLKHLRQFSLSRYEGFVSRGSARFFDVNGPKRVSDKHC